LDIHQILSFIENALQARAGLFAESHESAFRLFNGFYEGCADLAIDLYASTILIHNYAEHPEILSPWLMVIQERLLEWLPFVKTVVVKTRNAPEFENQRGRIVYGSAPDRKICEEGVWYAIDLLLNRDASFYLDTRNLRRWIMNHLNKKTVLNAFAYTGSLGVAAIASGAQRVVQLDRNRTFIKLAIASYKLNGFPIDSGDILVGDFFTQTSRMRRAGLGFDCVLIDPSFFSVTPKGRVNLAGEFHRLINKVRPLVHDDGWLVAVNNALFVSGEAYMAELIKLCADGYLKVEEIVPVPPDLTGYEGIIKNHPIVDPTPFNHSTKIAVLRVRKKNIS
jgi:23S rRNA (cytosine1962-C5)-methyltransferase